MDTGNISDNSRSEITKSPRHGKTPPPPPKPVKKSPKPPPKARELLKQIKKESKRRLLETQNEFAQTIHFPQNDNEDDDTNDNNANQLPQSLQEIHDEQQVSESESMHLSDIDVNDDNDSELGELENKPKLPLSQAAVQFSRNVPMEKRRSAATIENTDPSKYRTRQGRVHSKSVSSPNNSRLRSRMTSSVHKTPPPPPPPRPPRPSTQASKSSNQLSPYYRVNKDAGDNLDNSLIDLHLDDTQSWSGNEDDEKLQANNRSSHWGRSATVDLTNKLHTESKRSRKKPPPSHGTKSPPPPARPKNTTPSGHTRQRSSTTALLVTSKFMLDNEQIATASDKSDSTSHELLSSATEFVDEENIINDTQDAYRDDVQRKTHQQSLSSANVEDMERKSGVEEEDEDGFISDDASLPAPMFHRQSFHSVAPLVHSKSVSHEKPPTPATAEHAKILMNAGQSMSVSADRKKKRIIPKNHVQIAQLMKNDDRLSYTHSFYVSLLRVTQFFVIVIVICVIIRIIIVIFFLFHHLRK